MKKLIYVLFVLTLVTSVVGTAHAVPQYLTSLSAACPGTSCTNCHGPSGPPPFTAYGTSFSSIPTHSSDPAGAIASLGCPGGTPPAACTYTYSTWGACQSNNTQTRTVVSSSPSGCTGTPVLSQSCTYVPACTSYTYTLGACQSNGTAPVTGYTGVPAGCSGGATPATTQTCTYVPPVPPPACTSFTYTVGACRPDGTAPVTGYTGVPAGCSGGAVPATSQTCAYVPPPTTPDKKKPRITSFDIPGFSSSLTVTINSFTATDNVGVTGYIVKESFANPSAGDSSWSGTAPSSYTFTAEGRKILCAWVRDAAGNISPKRCDGVRIKLPLTAMPVPARHQVFTYGPVDAPVGGLVPSLAKPVGASVGNTVTMTADVGPFAGPVDIYLNIYELSSNNLQSASKKNKDDEPGDNDNSIYFRDDLQMDGIPSGPYVMIDLQTLQTENKLQIMPVGEGGHVKPWKEGATDVNETVLNGVPVSAFPSGPYVILFGVTPAGSHDHYYLWGTYFTIP